jgi:hypothetical protein
MALTRLRAGTALIGSIADARIPESAVSQHAQSFDDNKLVNDISTLALREASNNDRAAYNTNSSYIDIFQDATGIDTTTNAQRNSSEYVSSGVTSTESGGTETTWTTLSEGSSYFTLSSGTLVYNHSQSYNFSAYRDAVLAGNYWLRFKPYRSWSNNSASPPSGNDSQGFQAAIDYNDAGSRLTSNSIWNRNDSNFFWMGSRGLATSDNRHDFMRGQTRQATSTISGTSDTFYYFVRNTADSGTLKLYKGDYTDQNNLIHTYTGYSGTQTDAFGFAIGFPSSEETPQGGGVAQNVSYKTNITTLGGLTNVNATGNFTGTTITAPSSVSEMGAIITYQDNAGTNALNTDIVLQLSADGGSNYSTATLTALPDFSTGIKMAKVNDLAVTAGTNLKYKISFANQASGSKEARIRGVSLQY